MQLAAQKVAATAGRPIIADVTADLVDGMVKYDIDWKFQGDPATQKGPIVVPPKAASGPGTTIHFQLHDNSGRNLQFINPTSDAMWVSLTVTCPNQAGNGGQISYNHPWTPQTLKVDDANSGPACTLYYTLRFSGDSCTDPDGKQRPPYEYDPEIRNGGVPGIDDPSYALLIGAGVAALAIIAYFLFF